MKLVFRFFTTGAKFNLCDAAIARSLAEVGTPLSSLGQNIPHGVLRYSEDPPGHDTRGYTLHIYVDEDPPLDIHSFAYGRVEDLLMPMPSGEFAFSGDLSASAGPQPPRVPTGVYRATAFNVQWREELMSEPLRLKYRQAHERSMQGPLSFFLALVAVVSVFGWGLIPNYREAFGWAFVISAILFAVTLQRTEETLRREAAADLAALDFPDVVLVLKRIPDGAEIVPSAQRLFGPAVSGQTGLPGEPA